MAPTPRRDVRDITRPEGSLLTLYLVRSLILGPLFFIAFLPSYFKYRTLTYEFGDEGVTMAWGLLWRQEIYVGYPRIQDIHIRRGILERWWGLATIDVQTASGSAMAEISIVGLSSYEAVRDFLYSKMRGARFGEEEGEAGAAEEEAADAEAADEELVGLLTEIRDEVRSLRERVEQGRGA